MSEEKTIVLLDIEVSNEAIQHALEKTSIVFEIVRMEPVPEIPQCILKEKIPPGIVRPVESWQRKGRRKNKMFKR